MKIKFLLLCVLFSCTNLPAQTKEQGYFLRIGNKFFTFDVSAYHNNENWIVTTGEGKCNYGLMSFNLGEYQLEFDFRDTFFTEKYSQEEKTFIYTYHGSFFDGKNQHENVYLNIWNGDKNCFYMDFNLNDDSNIYLRCFLR